MRCIIVLILFLFCIATTLSAENFESTPDYSWANTPVGKFECIALQIRSGSSLQELKLGEKVIYRQPEDELIVQGNSIMNGIFMYQDLSVCPDIIENKAGYVIYQARLSGFGMNGQGPSDYVFGYYAINFNAVPPIIIDLAQLDMNRTQPKSPFVWDKDGFTMRYHGYPNGIASKKSKPHIIRFDFKAQKVKQIK
jgi:hypothetical protein